MWSKAWPDKTLRDAASTVVFIGDTFPANRLPNPQQNLADLDAMMQRGCGIVCVHYRHGPARRGCDAGGRSSRSCAGWAATCEPLVQASRVVRQNLPRCHHHTRRAGASRGARLEGIHAARRALHEQLLRPWQQARAQRHRARHLAAAAGESQTRDRRLECGACRWRPRLRHCNAAASTRTGATKTSAASSSTALSGPPNSRSLPKA